jgi:DNA recombination protein RmuC
MDSVNIITVALFIILPNLLVFLITLIFVFRAFKNAVLQNQELSSEIMLAPLRDEISKIKEYTEKALFMKEKELFALKSEINKLADASYSISKEAFNLTNVLKGDVKVQGYWGEMILENILNSAGLRKNYEYVTQTTIEKDGLSMRPDVIIKLPQNRQVVIDAKVSLTNYLEYLSETDHQKIQEALSRHCISVQNHIKILSSKEYTKYFTDNLDFVIMFMPVESAFAALLTTDTKLFDKAFEKNVIIAGPTVLFGLLKVIDKAWKKEYVGQNVISIMEQNLKVLCEAELLLGNFNRLGEQITKLQDQYNKIITQLYDGPASLSNHIKKLQLLTGKNNDEAK